MLNRPTPQRILPFGRAFFCLAWASHILSGVLFFAFGLKLPGGLLSVVSLLYAISLFLEKKHPEAILRAVRYEMCAFSLLMTVLLGLGSGFFFYALAAMASCLLMKKQEFIAERWLQLVSLLVLLIPAAMLALFPEQFRAVLTLKDSRCAVFFLVNLICSCGEILLWHELTLLSTSDALQKLQGRAKKLEYLATHDALTGLANRRSINELLILCRAQAERSGIPFTVAMGDIDNFKSFNDAYGHNCGDQILTMLASAIQCATREGDFVCRWGGEEILILFSATRSSAAKAVLQRVQEKISHLGEDRDSFIATPVTMTFGISEYETGQSIEGLIQNADEKLYQGKNSGKNCIIL